MHKLNQLYWSTAVACFVLLTQSKIVNAQSDSKYRNVRYGFSFSIVKGLKSERSPDNGDGIRLKNGKGFSISAYGSNNVLTATLLDEVKSQSRTLDKVTYRAKGKNWYVLSGLKGSKVVYIKGFVGDGSINTMLLEYPKNDERAYDALVTQLSRGFRPGNLRTAH
jgi:hypothetical protein